MTFRKQHSDFLSEQSGTDPMLQLAGQFVSLTNTNIFLTGRAGTGKTTFLRNLSKLTQKRYVVLAPTGVAAINAGGQTIHSFFQLPFGPVVPGTVLKRKEKDRKESFALQLRKSKIDIIRSLDLIVIDEISMVRADLLDAVDEVLQHYRKNNKPFGGLQMLMIGDLLQLPPVVKNEEWDLLRDHYENLFFYSSKALIRSNFVTITLETVFRQTDERFVALLNAVRSGQPDAKVLEELNKRYCPDTGPYETQGYITLTTHNRMADDINQNRLALIKQPVYKAKAVIRGDFPEHIYPTHETLELKTGAQVMFVKNDPGPEKRYYNGLIGTIVDIDEENNTADVACEGLEEPITVGPIEWQNTVYELDNETKDIIEKVNGTFAQLPLRLAWAVTIHKSQGLTFDKVIIDAAAAFAHGQVYVALSRCRTLEGLVFKSRIPMNAVKSHQGLTSWLDGQKATQPDEQQLSTHSTDFVKQLLTELFDFSLLRSKTDYLLRTARRNISSLQPGFADKISDCLNIAENQLEAIGKKFEPQLLALIGQAAGSGNRQALAQRLNQASEYFKQHLHNFDKTLPGKIETDDKALRKSLSELKKEIDEIVAVKNACLGQLGEGFQLEAFIKARALAGISTTEKTEESVLETSMDSNSPETLRLKQMLLQWRKEEASQQGIEPSRVVPMTAIFEMAANPPHTIKQLQTIKGIGKKKVAQYGQAIIALIDKCIERKAPEPAEKAPKKNSRELTLEIYENNPGVGLDMLASLRGLAVSTVADHLCFGIEQGKVDVAAFVDEAKRSLIEEYFESVDDDKLGSAREVLGFEVSFIELKMVRAALRHKGFWSHSTEIE